jgi:hypothetical protein
MSKLRDPNFGEEEGSVELYTPILILQSRKGGEVNCEVFPPVPST